MEPDPIFEALDSLVKDGTLTKISEETEDDRGYRTLRYHYDLAYKWSYIVKVKCLRRYDDA